MDSDLAHGIGVQNRYALFYDEDVDPLEILRQQEEEKRKRKIDKTQCKDKKPVKPGKGLPTIIPKKPNDSLPVKPADPIEVPNKPRGGKQMDRPPRSTGNYQDTRESEKNNRNKDDNYFNPERAGGDRDGGEFRRGRGGFRGGRGRGGERGGGRGGYFNNADNRPRRMFDRHSGSDKTGVRPTEKRDGAGQGNWGDVRSEINQRREGWEEEEFEGEKPVQLDETQDENKPMDADVPLDSSETKENDQTTEEQIQESVKEMTLDEWKKEQETKRTVPKYNLRKPGEGEDDKQWKKTFVLKKKIKEDDDEESDEEDEEYQRKNPKVLLDFQFNFTDSRRGTRGRGRGGRGGPRGGGMRDGGVRDSPREDRVPDARVGRREGPNKPRGQQAAPRVDDFNDFPSLVNA